VGTALGPAGINIGDFVNKFNTATKDLVGDIIPVEISIYSDRSFDFIIKQPPVSAQLFEVTKVKGGSAQPNRVKVGKVNWKQIEDIAKDKMVDMNCFTLESAMKMVAGTARSMGLTVDGEAPFKK